MRTYSQRFQYIKKQCKDILKGHFTLSLQHFDQSYYIICCDDSEHVSNYYLHIVQRCFVITKSHILNFIAHTRVSCGWTTPFVSYFVLTAYHAKRGINFLNLPFNYTTNKHPEMDPPTITTVQHLPKLSSTPCVLVGSDQNPESPLSCV